MRRRTFVRGLAGTMMMFGILVLITIAFILGEHWLENFKSH